MIHIYVSSSFHSKLVVESDSLNVISWVSSPAVHPCRFQFYLNEIRCLSSSIQVVLGRPINGFVRIVSKASGG